MILVAAVPDLPETGYGWAEPGDRLKGRSHFSIRKVKSLHEKPNAELLRAVSSKGFSGTQSFAHRDAARHQYGEMIPAVGISAAIERHIGESH
jgi:mannose-1-phosphate guanylyltransferase